MKSSAVSGIAFSVKASFRSVVIRLQILTVLLLSQFFKLTSVEVDVSANHYIAWLIKAALKLVTVFKVAL